MSQLSLSRLPDVDPEIVKEVRYMLSQGVSVGTVAAIHGIGPAVVELLSEYDTEPSGPSVEDRQARVIELKEKIQKLRNENEKLKRKMGLKI